MEKKTQHCAPTPNGPFHCYARGPDPRCQGVLSGRVVVLCSSYRRTRTHNQPVGLPLLHQRSFLERSLWSSIADRTIGIRLHCNFTVALPDVAGTASNPRGYTFSINRFSFRLNILCNTSSITTKPHVNLLAQEHLDLSQAIP